MALGAQTVQVKVELDAEAFQDALQHAIDDAAQAALKSVQPTEHVHPEEVRVGDVLLVPVRVVTIQPPSVDGDPARPHIRTVVEAGPWAVDRAGRLWTHGWTLTDFANHKLERRVKP